MKKRKHCSTKRLITQSIIAMRNLALTMKLSEVDKGVDVINYKTSSDMKQYSSSTAPANETPRKLSRFSAPFNWITEPLGSSMNSSDSFLTENKPSASSLSNRQAIDFAIT